MKLKLYFLIFTIAILLNSCEKNVNTSYLSELESFENNLEKSRILLKIPGFSAAIIKERKIIWAKGFGYADVKNKRKATPNTSYHLASLTKTFASIIILELVEQGKVNLDDSILKYGINLDEARQYNMNVVSEEKIKVKHLLSHTAEGIPGTYYNYNGYLFSLLDNVIERASGKTFGELVTDKIIKPLEMSSTAPNICDTTNFNLTGYDPTIFYENLAKPYILDSLNNIIESKLETYFGTAAGLMSSVIDMAKYSIAIDENKFLDKKTQDIVFNPTVSTNGDTLPYGLGWFVQNYKGIKMIWHYGLWNTNSSLIIRVPERDLALVILANSNNLTRPFSLGTGDVLTSIFAVDFFKKFIFSNKALDINWDLSFEDLKKQLHEFQPGSYQELLQKELYGQARLHFAVGDQDRVQKLFQLYTEVYSKNIPEKFATLRLLANLDNIKDNEERTSKFNIHSPTTVTVFSIGEGLNGKMSDFGWIEDLSNRVVWRMNEPETVHAGGDLKNRLIDTTFILQPGTYKLKYKSDDSHSFNLWNTLPPSFAFYGIRVYEN
ncbi:MAG: serine hydrolase domain-containing protein [Candidatus Neomarinimicrobiota bacterium]